VGDTLVFVYNANSGFFNGLADLAHKTLSPDTYACHLCRLTYSPLGMRRGWKRFLSELDFDLEFLHRDELRTEDGMSNLALPAILLRRTGTISVLVDAPTLNRCETLQALQQCIQTATSPHRE
jgi:hypothetical protein